MARHANTLIQITDMHIFDEADGRLGGVKTRESLQRVLDVIARDHADADLLVLTGDNTHESTTEAYRVLKQMVSKTGLSYTFLPGNHDYEEPMMTLAIDGEQESDKWLVMGNWNILLLDSHEEAKVNGVLSADELSFAEQILKNASGPVIAFLHHPLLPVGCDWLDRQRVANADALFDIMARHGNVKAVINGHVHQDWSGEHRGIKLYSTPSTCMQFKPNSYDYAEDAPVPAYRWIKLYDDGTFETAVVRVR